jgi:glutathione synthase/RimK-type ligase-like ATP-grasp enzyme
MASSDERYVVVSRTFDPHIELVDKYLPQKMLVLDPYEIADGTASLSFRAGRYPGIIVNGTLINNVRSVWVRKPLIYETDIINLGIDKRFREYSLHAIRRHIAMLYGVLQDSTWVSDYWAIRRASNKYLQLIEARKLGFRVPETLFTSNASQARNFVSRRKESIVKQNDGQPTNEASPRILYTTTITKSDTEKIRNTSPAPAIFQQKITCKADIRVTVVGGCIFAASIRPEDHKEAESIRDWRANYNSGTGKFAVYSLPKKTEHMCVALVKQLGLKFGAIDLIEDVRGNIWFLEINPNGQWGFIEEDTDLPIAKSIAKLMAGREI